MSDFADQRHRKITPADKVEFNLMIEPAGDPHKFRIPVAPLSPDCAGSKVSEQGPPE